MQTKKGSMFEITCNYTSGFFLAWATWQFVSLPAMAYMYSLGYSEPETGFAITWIMTVQSVVRSYFWRRLFNHHQIKSIARK